MPHIEFMSGSAMGRRIQLDRSSYLLGRDPTSDIPLDGGAVSRLHAKLLAENDGYYIQDNQSRNGTFVNGKLIAGAHLLQDGDSIRICDIDLVYGDERSSTNIKIPEAGSKTENKGILISDDENEESSFRTVTGRIDISGSQYGVNLSVTPEAQLAALLEISKNLSNTLEVSEVFPKVLDSLFSIFLKADRGYLVMKNEAGKLVLHCAKSRRDEQEVGRPSKNALLDAMNSKQAHNSVDSEQDFSMSESVADMKIRSMLNVPLLSSQGEAIGGIQIVSNQQKGGFEDSDLEILSAAANQAAIVIENAQMHERMLAQKMVEKDLELAKKVQEAFLPKSQPKHPGLSFFDYYKAAEQVGGDYFDYFELENGKIVIALADVVGHGVAAAMLMAKLSAEARFAFASISDPRKAMEQLNNRITALDADRFITMSVIVFDVASSKATIVIAGHMPPIHYRADGSIHEPGGEEDIGGPALGIESDIKFDSVEITLEPGETLTMYTDGIFEAPNADGQQFSMERIRKILQGAKSDVNLAGKTVIAQVTDHIVGCAQEDDMCMVIVGRDEVSSYDTAPDIA